MKARISANVSKQSQKLDDKKNFEEEVEKIYQKAKNDEDKVKREESWGGYRIVPEKVEFWQGQKSRIHDRFVYESGADGSWKITQLYP